MNTISVDFDRVIHDIDARGTERMGPPVEGAVQALQALSFKYRIVVYTLRATKPDGKDHVRQWLYRWQVPFADISGTKPDAIAYIDDRGIRFTTWPETLTELERST